MLLSNFHNKYAFEAGCDEVGRGCLAGPVVAASVILPVNFTHPYLTDSKKLNAKKRANLAQEIKESSIAWAIASCSPEEIDEVNILNASFLAMHRAIKKLSQMPDFLLIDGNRFTPYVDIDHACIVKGDSKYFSIAAASILAKEFRDNLMRELAIKHPYYGWEQNVGYPTKLHKAGISEFGICEWHRKSFKLEDKQMQLLKT